MTQPEIDDLLRRLGQADYQHHVDIDDVLEGGARRQRNRRLATATAAMTVAAVLAWVASATLFGSDQPRRIDPASSVTVPDTRYASGWVLHREARSLPTSGQTEVAFSFAFRPASGADGSAPTQTDLTSYGPFLIAFDLPQGENVCPELEYEPMEGSVSGKSQDGICAWTIALKPAPPRESPLGFRFTIGSTEGEGSGDDFSSLALIEDSIAATTAALAATDGADFPAQRLLGVEVRTGRSATPGMTPDYSIIGIFDGANSSDPPVELFGSEGQLGPVLARAGASSPTVTAKPATVCTRAREGAVRMRARGTCTIEFRSGPYVDDIEVEVVDLPNNPPDAGS